ncbi:hypothetical protein BDV29DRAFT_123863 [Aspergillus leporis]|jgi:hypothetical protein|uniref:Uncharacterized protein n=1 Tax=Aspergillus leporis TaxID=41062 RepID=A0A5N5X2W9_9EURO|nr:hypothetical protein BDV29DRAFT_123863 [Aspergillus leporis]
MLVMIMFTSMRGPVSEGCIFLMCLIFGIQLVVSWRLRNVTRLYVIHAVVHVMGDDMHGQHRVKLYRKGVESWQMSLLLIVRALSEFGE